MKKRFVFFVLFCILFIILFVVFLLINNTLNITSVFNSKTANEALTVIVDAGHGGEDGGAVAPDGTVEKDINLDVALKLQKVLQLYGFNVIMTRTEDTMTYDGNFDTQREKKVSDIRNRFKIIEEHPDAIFVSVHQNNFYDSSQSGTQVFYSKNNFKSKTLADEIQKTFVNNIQPDNRRQTKKSGTEIYLLYHSRIPSVLVECGFLSNYNDLNQLKNEDYRMRVAILIADGILKYSLNG